MRLVPDPKAKVCRFEVVEGKQIDFEPNKGTVQQGKASCPFCQTIIDGNALRTESKAKRMGQQMMAVVTNRQKQKGKTYRPASAADEVAYQQAVKALETVDFFGNSKNCRQGYERSTESAHFPEEFHA